MRNRIALFAALLALFTVIGTAWASSVYVETTTTRATLTVDNTTYAYPLVCSGKVYGETSSGRVYYVWVNQMIVPGGQYRYAYVYTDYRDPFVRGWSDVVCRTY